VTFGRVGHLGATLPGVGITDAQAFGIEAVLTLGLVSTILGTASGAQNVGPLSAVAVGGYIAVAFSLVDGGLPAADSPYAGLVADPVSSHADGQEPGGRPLRSKANPKVAGHS
jgi:hypothetical protein